jgi:hypothetical protein
MNYFCDTQNRTNKKTNKHNLKHCCLLLEQIVELLLRVILMLEKLISHVIYVYFLLKKNTKKSEFRLSQKHTIQKQKWYVIWTSSLWCCLDCNNGAAPAINGAIYLFIFSKIFKKQKNIINNKSIIIFVYSAILWKI